MPSIASNSTEYFCTSLSHSDRKRASNCGDFQLQKLVPHHCGTRNHTIYTFGSISATRRRFQRISVQIPLLTEPVLCQGPRQLMVHARPRFGDAIKLMQMQLYVFVYFPLLADDQLVDRKQSSDSRNHHRNDCSPRRRSIVSIRSSGRLMSYSPLSHCAYIYG